MPGENVVNYERNKGGPLRPAGPANLLALLERLYKFILFRNGGQCGRGGGARGGII